MDKTQRLGEYIECTLDGAGAYKAYVPQKLPPNPEIEMEKLYPLLDRANLALGRLDGVRELFDSKLFVFMYVRKEAVLSSQIEGTQSSLSDLLMFENDAMPSVPLDDVNEVSSYVKAMTYGLRRIIELPLSLRLIREIHTHLMQNTRGMKMNPGEFRSIQNRIGGTNLSNAHFVPPPHHLEACLHDFEAFLHNKAISPLIKAALAHAQFETIHPFLDGNGRLGRLLITFILCAEGVLEDPLLYLSLYLKTHRQAYYDHLQAVRVTGDWEAWISFFLQGVIETSNQAFETARAILTLFRNDREIISKSAYSSKTLLMVFMYMQQVPVTDVSKLCKATGKTLPTVIQAVERLETLGIIHETTGRSRNKIYIYKSYIDLMNDGIGQHPLSKQNIS